MHTTEKKRPALSERAVGKKTGYLAMELKSQKRQPESSAAAGRVKTQASAISRTVDICRPLLFAAMVPAMPELSTWVVLTGRPRLSAIQIVTMAVISAEAPCA